MGLEAQLETVVSNLVGSECALQVHCNPNFGGSVAETVTLELWACDVGLYRKLGRMAAMVRAAMDMGKEPAFLLHLRFWGCEWISRSPTDADGMGFWARPIAQSVWPTE